jgi:hypothetical protein
MALAALLVTACLGAAASGKPAVQAQKLPAAAPTQLAPTQLDYLVLASLADSQQLLSMAGYRPNQ